MMVLKKARLTQLTGAATPVPIGPAFDVQFNPTSLKLTMNNNIDAGRTRGHQVQQYTGTSSTTLAMDLVFDTADEGTDAAPVDVRTKTAKVIKFLLPTAQSKKAPPRVRFSWGRFIFEGVMFTCTEDLELFSPDGVPLRAKCSVSIKEQDPKYEALQRGPGAAGGTGEGAGAASNNPGEPPAGVPGSTSGSRNTDRTAPALGGESAADFAARNGLDPAAWRGLAADIANPLSLPAGLDISFDSGLSASAGLGVTLGTGASVGVGVEASLGLQADASLGLSAAVSARFALSAAGGVTAAVQTASIVRTETAASQARAAFGSPSSSGGAAPTRGAGSLPAAAAGALTSGQPAGTVPSTIQQRSSLGRALAVGAASAPVGTAAGSGLTGAVGPGRPVADPRAATFGYGVPLRPQVTGPADDRPGASTWIRVGAKPRAPEPVMILDPTLPPWVGLRPLSTDRRSGDVVHPVGRCRRAGCDCRGHR